MSLYPQVAFDTIKVLEKAGCTVKYNAQQTCCGQPAFNAGFWGESKDVCTKFVQDFEGADYIVSPSASCAGFVRNKGIEISSGKYIAFYDDDDI